MQFNPIFLPANSSTDFVKGNDVKAFSNAKYLFSELVKVTAPEKTPKEFSKYINEKEVCFNEFSDGNKAQFDYNKPHEENLSAKLTENSSLPLITVISSLIEPNEKNMLQDFAKDHSTLKEVEINNVEVEYAS